MTRATYALLILADLLLFARIIISRDLVMGLTIAVVQLAAALVLLNFKWGSRTSKFSLKSLVFPVVACLVLAPCFTFLTSQNEATTWAEVGLMLRGPMGILSFGLLGMALATGFLLSAYSGDHDDLA